MSIVFIVFKGIRVYNAPSHVDAGEKMCACLNLMRVCLSAVLSFIYAHNIQPEKNFSQDVRGSK